MLLQLIISIYIDFPEKCLSMLHTIVFKFEYCAKMNLQQKSISGNEREVKSRPARLGGLAHFAPTRSRTVRGGGTLMPL